MKLKSKKGFTLMELLIVVAIIGVLVAITIPAFSSSLTKAQQATDQANIRSAVALATVEHLTEGSFATATYKVDGTFSGSADDYAMKTNGTYKGYNYAKDDKINVAVSAGGVVSVTFPTT